MDNDRTPIEMPIPGPGMPRESGGPPVWIVPVAVLAATALAILAGALWR